MYPNVYMLLPPSLSLMSWLIKANRICPQPQSALCGLSPKKGNYRFYGVIILRKLPNHCPNLESTRKTFSLRRNLPIN